MGMDEYEVITGMEKMVTQVLSNSLTAPYPKIRCGIASPYRPSYRRLRTNLVREPNKTLKDARHRAKKTKLGRGTEQDRGGYYSVPSKKNRFLFELNRYSPRWDSPQVAQVEHEDALFILVCAQMLERF